VLAMKLPGPGTIYLSQFMEFKAPVRIGDTVTARVEVKEKVAEKNRVKLRTTCVNQDGTLLVDGEALIMPPKAPKK
jgi:3-hydroxybutyryl-CoA dehydratase